MSAANDFGDYSETVPLHRTSLENKTTNLLQLPAMIICTLLATCAAHDESSTFVVSTFSALDMIKSGDVNRDAPSSKVYHCQPWPNLAWRKEDLFISHESLSTETRNCHPW